MSISFCIDLNQYALYRHIGSEKEPLKHRVDRSDIIACLSNLGYNNISEVGTTRLRYGVIPCLEETLTSATLGVPTDAFVAVKPLARHSSSLMIVFTF